MGTDCKVQVGSRNGGRVNGWKMWAAVAALFTALLGAGALAMNGKTNIGTTAVLTQRMQTVEDCVEGVKLTLDKMDTRQRVQSTKLERVLTILETRKESGHD